MELIKDQQHQMIGKVENMNVGDHFANITVWLETDEKVNIKVDKEMLKEIQVGKLFQFKCGVKERKDELYLWLNQIEPLKDVVSDEILHQHMSFFYRYAPISLHDIKQDIEDYLSQIQNEILKDIATTIYEVHKDMFYLHPAATKFHHAYIGGLSYHTLTMLRLIDPFIRIYPYLNRDLLIAGTLLHDMSKIDEISGVDGDYTIPGQLLGHLVMGSMDIDRIAVKKGYEHTEEVLLLKHMIISHHGQLNFGSPKKPQIGEALLLWYIDSIDSKFTVLGEELSHMQEGGFTQPIAVLDKMRFYKPRKI